MSDATFWNQATDDNVTACSVMTCLPAGAAASDVTVQVPHWSMLHNTYYKHYPIQNIGPTQQFQLCSEKHQSQLYYIRNEWQTINLAFVRVEVLVSATVSYTI